MMQMIGAYFWIALNKASSVYYSIMEYVSVPVGHSVRAKETYASVKQLLSLIKYDHHNSVFCVDLKMVNFLLGQQSGYTKFPCFLCLWDSRTRESI